MGIASCKKYRCGFFTAYLKTVAAVWQVTKKIFVRRAVCGVEEGRMALPAFSNVETLLTVLDFRLLAA